MQRRRRSGQPANCGAKDDGAVRHELVRRLEAVAVPAAVDDEVDVEMTAGRDDLLGTLRVAVLRDHRRRRVRTVANYDEVWTVRTAANQSPTFAQPGFLIGASRG